MKLLLDSSVWGPTADELRSAGHDVDWVGGWPEDPGDPEILASAHRAGRVLVTLDKDFGELAVRQGMPHSGILRLVEMPVTRQARLCLHVLRLYGEELSAGAIITADPKRIRIRAPRGEEP